MLTHGLESAMSREGTERTPDRLHPGAFIVLVADPVVEELDAYGPMSWPVAQTLARRIRTGLDCSGIHAVSVAVVALSGPRGAVRVGTAVPER